MFTPTELLFMLLAPVLVLFAGLGAAAWLRRGSSFWRQRPGWEGAALAVAAVVSWCALTGALPAGDVHHRLPLIAGGIALVGLIAAPAQGAWWWSWTARVAVIVSALALVVPATSAWRGWSSAEAALWLSGLGLGWAVIVWSWERSASTAMPGLAVLSLMAASVAGTVALALFGSMRYPLFGGVLCSGLGVALVAVWWRGAWFSVTNLATAAALLIPLLWYFGVYLSDLPLWSVPLLSAAGATAWLGSLGRLRSAEPWKRLLVVALASALVVAPVLIYGVVQSIRDSSPGY